MVVSQPKSFRDAIKPLVYFNCFSGLGALRQPDHSDAVYFFTSFYTVVANLVSWTAIYVTLNSMEQVIDFDYASPMVLTMYRALVCVNSFIAVIAPLLVWLQRKVVKECLQKMSTLDDTLQSVLGVEKEYRSQYIRLNCRLIAVALVMFMVGIWDTAFSLGIELQMNAVSVFRFYSVTLAMHHPILVMLLLNMNFCIFVGYLGKKFRNLNESLLRLGEKPSSLGPAGQRLFVKTRVGNKFGNTETVIMTNEKHYLLREIQKAHMELCKLSQKLNSAFGIQNLISTGLSFGMVTGLLYTIYSALSSKSSWDNSKLKELISTSIWAAIHAYKIWIVNHSCWSVSSEAERTGEVVYELRDSRIDKELDKEIQEFTVQMLKNPVRFNACGFFTMDYSFVQGVIGSITTYLVILIQMSNSSEISASNPRHNVTGI